MPGDCVTIAGRPLPVGDATAFAAAREIDVLIPTRNRPAELAATLAGLAAQDVPEPFGVVISDQSDGTPQDSVVLSGQPDGASEDGVVAKDGVVRGDRSDGAFEDGPSWGHPAAATMVRVLRCAGHRVLLGRHLPRRGLAEHRAFLLSRSRARYVLYLDDDVWLEPMAVRVMHQALRELGCGFVGNFPHGLSYADDHRPAQQVYEPWLGRPAPEWFGPGDPQWRRASLHGAANLLHLADSLRLPPGQWRAYKVAWLGACVLFDRAKLVAAGGYDFWDRLPAEHAGEDVVAQQRVMRWYGGAGLVPSHAYHLESPTTVRDRRVQCHEVVR